LRAAEITAGDVDPTCGAALIDLGYDRDFDELADAGLRSRPLASSQSPGPAADWRCVLLDAGELTVRLPTGVRIDLGATAKALAADLAARLIGEQLGCGVLVNLGGDIAIAGPPPDGGWRIGCRRLRGPSRGGSGRVESRTRRRRRGWRRGHILPGRALLASREPTVASHRRSEHRTARRYLLDGGHGSGGHLCRRQHREHGFDHQGPGSSSLAGGPQAAGQAGSPRWRGAHHGRLAELSSFTHGSFLWYATRAAGLITLLLLTASVVLGTLTAGRFASRSWPRFVVQGLHRNLALLALGCLILHIGTTVIDTYTSIGLPAAFVPFSSGYKRWWLGLGAVACDLMLLLALSSLVRERIGHRLWRVIHWAGYLCWPVAIAHGLGTGTDHSTTWVLA